MLLLFLVDKNLVFKDKALGKLKLFGENEVFFANKKVILYIGCWRSNHGEYYLKDELETIHKLFTNQSNWMRKIKDFIVEELLEDQKSEYIDLRKESKNFIAEDFLNRIKIKSIRIKYFGGFYITYITFDGDEIFGGHSFYITANINENFMHLLIPVNENTITYDKMHVNFEYDYDKEIVFANEKVHLTIDSCEIKSAYDLLVKQNQDKWLKKIKDFAVQKLLENEIDRVDNSVAYGKKFTKEDFYNNLKLKRLHMDEDGNISAYFDDIVVYTDIKGTDVR